MCTVLLPPGDNPMAVNKYIISVCAILYRLPPGQQPQQKAECLTASNVMVKHTWKFISSAPKFLVCMNDLGFISSCESSAKISNLLSHY
jgi:hypothetical protein